MDENSQKALGAIINLLPNIYKDVAQPSLQALGKALGNTVRFCTIPLTALGTVDDLVQANLSHHLNEYRKKLDKIPEDKITEVPPELSVPVIQRLSYTRNNDIANLFTNLLATASNKDTVDIAHPGFESIISQLSPDEARIIQYLQKHEVVEYCDLRAYPPKGAGFQVLYEKATMIPTRVKLDFPQNINAYLSNLNRLGIIEDMNGLLIMDNTSYDEIKKANEFYLFDNLVPTEYRKLDIHKSYFSVTSYGRMFVTACTDLHN